MAMDDELFLTKINEIARENRLRLPALRSGELPSAAFLAEWAKFLEECVKKGVALSDERWRRLTVESRIPAHRLRPRTATAATACRPGFSGRARSCSWDCWTSAEVEGRRLAANRKLCPKI